MELFVWVGHLLTTGEGEMIAVIENKKYLASQPARQNNKFCISLFHHLLLAKDQVKNKNQLLVLHSKSHTDECENGNLSYFKGKRV